jgi:LysM repeat protein
VPSPYKPPLPRRAQAVQSARGRLRQRLRVWWLVPLLGLLPVVVAAVLANEGVFNAPPRQPAASGPPAAAPTQASVSQPAAAPVGATPPPTQAAVTTVTTTSPPAAALPAAGQPTPTAVARAAVQSSVSPVATTTQASDNATATGPFRAYRVQSGDTLRFIAEVYGVSTASIIQASGLQNPDRLRIGQVLTVPNQAGWLYRIQPGETLDLIAARTGVPTDLIASASNVSSTSARAGDVILIPAQTVVRSK